MSDHHEKAAILWNAFKERLGQTGEISHPLNLINLITRVEDLQDLDSPFTKQEIDSVFKHLPSDKAPGPDGRHAIFFKKYWGILGDEITQEVLFAINRRQIPEEWNDTSIALIPKVDSPELITQYRPISLCNVLYKIATKVLANRLKGILPLLISEEQSAFVPGRLITDNVLVAYECVHAIRNRKRKRPLCAVKLDM